MNKSEQTSCAITAFVSGKGGVGKTSLCLNIASLMARKGRKVLVMDGDFGLANLDVQLGVAAEKNLIHVLNGQATLKDIMVQTEQGFTLIPGASGSGEMSLINRLQQHNILKDLKDLSAEYDAIFIDVAAGVDGDALDFANFADETMLVVTPDPSSITDGYAVVKMLWQTYQKNNIQVLVNQAGGDLEGKQTFAKLQKTVKHFLKMNISLMGMISYDRQYSVSVKMQQVLSVAFPGSKASKQLEKVVDEMIYRQGAVDASSAGAA